MVEVTRLTCRSLFLSLSAAACISSNLPGPEPTPASLDALTTAPRVLGAQASEYEVHPPTEEGGVRTYAFVLRPRSGMEVDRHFHIVTVAWVPSDAAATDEPMSVGGPGGGFTTFSSRTEDGRFELRVTEGMLLPDAVELPALDPSSVLARLKTAYEDREE